MARFFTAEIGQARGQIHFRKQPRKKICPLWSMLQATG